MPGYPFGVAGVEKTRRRTFAGSIREFSGYFLDLRDLRPGGAAFRHDDPHLGPGWLRFSEPARVLVAEIPGEVASVLEEASRYAASGGWAVGFVSYEAGPAFDAALAAKTSDWPVLAWFACFERAPRFYRELLPGGAAQVDLEAPEMDLARYADAFDRVRRALAGGESYQVNLTFRQPFRLHGEAADFFADRCGVRPPDYAAFIHGGDWQIASFSPELFVERTGDHVETRPMKGTTPAPESRAEIPARTRSMTEDAKSIAENIMIVDMVRNDLGTIATPGSVETPRLLRVEKHRGLLQMTSTVTARSSVPTPELVARLFPAASITGAPKVSATRLIAEIEDSPRHVYCGAIGILSPEGQRFSVAIRTALLRDGRGEFGVGSGLVWDSEVASEYEECLAKRDFLLRSGPAWALVEAIPVGRLGEDKYVDRHLDRMEASAFALHIPFDRSALRAAIAEHAGPAEPRTKLRIALNREGFALRRLASELPPGTLRATLAEGPVARRDPNFHHKTTSRGVFDAALDAHPEFDEVLLFNEDGELTEFCRGNLIVEIAGVLYTPPFEAGCLPGIYVSERIERGELHPRVLRPDDLRLASRVFLANSVVGRVEVRLASDAVEGSGERAES